MLDLALKEWAVITDLLLTGDQVILLRKGGIHEYDGPGRFRLENESFALFPAWEHQHPEWIKPKFQHLATEFQTESQSFQIKGIGTVTPGHIWTVPSREAFDSLDDLHAWLPPQIDMRFNYKPERPLYLMAVRAYKLPEPKTITMNDHYWGCKSWVDLEPDHKVDDSNVIPAIEDEKFEQIVEQIKAAMNVS